MGASVNKLLLEIDGEPMVRRVVRRALDAGLEHFVVVLGYEPDRVRESLDGLECTFVESPDYTGPTSRSLHAGPRALDSSVSATVVMLGDIGSRYHGDGALVAGRPRRIRFASRRVSL